MLSPAESAFSEYLAAPSAVPAPSKTPLRDDPFHTPSVGSPTISVVVLPLTAVASHIPPSGVAGNAVPGPVHELRLGFDCYNFDFAATTIFSEFHALTVSEGVSMSPEAAAQLPAVSNTVGRTEHALRETASSLLAVSLASSLGVWFAFPDDEDSTRAVDVILRVAVIPK
jgi:hypothetical protein